MRGSRVAVTVGKRRSLGWAVLLLSLFALSVPCAFAQRPTEPGPIPSSELTKDNLDKVAASESQITSVLNANPGLLVELKRWAARDAADRGQILRDSDLSAAILSQLSDARFRAAATRLV